MTTPYSKSEVRKVRIGLLVPSSNTVMENDLHAGLPEDRYTVHTARMYLEKTTREAELKMIQEYAQKAAKDVGTARLDLLVFGCTSAGSLFGLDYDRKVCAELGELARCAALGTISAVNDTLDARGFRKIAVITPYNDDLTRAVAAAAENDTRKVVAAHGMGIDVNVELATPSPTEIVAFAVERLRGVEMDGLFVSCTNYQAVEAREALQRAFGVPIVTSNSAVIEHIRKRFG